MDYAFAFAEKNAICIEGKLSVDGARRELERRHEYHEHRSEVRSKFGRVGVCRDSLPNNDAEIGQESRQELD